MIASRKDDRMRIQSYNTSRYLRHLQLKIEAEQWVNAAKNKDALVAGLMFHLNRYAGARHGFSNLKRSIYAAKTNLIHHLSHAYPTKISMKHQVLKCNACTNGRYIGSWFEDECFRCGGTGIYSETNLYEFAINVDGRSYVWHQPASLVWWRAKLDDPFVSEFNGRKSGVDIFDGEIIRLYLFAVDYYLGQLGYKRQVLLADSLMSAIRGDYYSTVKGFMWDIRWSRIGRIYHRLQPRKNNASDDIPF